MKTAHRLASQARHNPPSFDTSMLNYVAPTVPYSLSVRAPVAPPVSSANLRKAAWDTSVIIDFDAGRWTKVDKPGRSLATLSRIQSGRSAHGARFVTAYYGNESGGRSLNRPIGTITTRDRWAVIDGDRMRMLSVDECRKAMGFPSSYQLPSRAKDAMHMLGNAVVPVVACDVINALRAAA